MQFLRDRQVGVLAAPSGMGKTSLLHAKVLPLLEKERWLVVYARPGENPLTLLQVALCDHLLPDPRAEAAVVESLAAALPEHDASVLSSGLSWHETLQPGDRIPLRLFAPPAESEFVPLPVMSRALRGSIDTCDLIEHFEALVVDGPALGLTPHTPLADLAQRLRCSETVKLWRAWRARFEQAPSLTGALAFLQREWLPLRPGIAAVLLVLDQFEEMFTRLPPGSIDEFMSVARELFMTNSTAAPAKPQHLALSLRKEFFADVVPHLQMFGAVEQSTFFLGPMPLDQARNALTRPAALFGLTFAEESPGGCVDRILSLTLDDGAIADQKDAAQEIDGKVDLPTGRRYAPALISLVGAHLWERLQEEPKPVPPVTWSDFQRLVPRLEDVFETFLGNALDTLEKKTAAGGAGRFDALELLDRLVTPSGFRNIIAEEELIDQLPLSRKSAERLLDCMDHDLRLIRRESRRCGRIMESAHDGATPAEDRRSGRFVEIMHERLIPPVRRMLTDLRRRDLNRATLSPAYDMLYMLPDEADPTKDPLPAHFREALFQYLNRLELDELAAKNVLRSLLMVGPGMDGRGTVATQGWTEWAQAVGTLTDALSNPVAAESTRRQLLTGTQLDAAISALARQDSAPDSDVVRHAALSALADRTDGARHRIERVFSSIVESEHHL